MTVRKLWVGQKRVKVVPQKNNSFSRDLSIQDGRGNILAIQIRNFGLDVDRSFDCVTLSARYDHGFGFSQLFRFVDDKESKLIETICDSANFEVVPKLLPWEFHSRSTENDSHPKSLNSHRRCRVK